VIENSAMSNPYANPYPAPTYPPKVEENTLGLIGFILSLAGLFLCVAAPIGLILSLMGLRRDPKGFALAGTIIGGITTVFYGIIAALYGVMILAMFAACIGIGVAAQPFAQTTVTLNDARQRIENARTAENTYPSEAEGDQLIAGLRDFWQTPLRYEPQGTRFAIRSAGPDKQFNTPDDMTIDELGSGLQMPPSPQELFPENSPIILPDEVSTED
jgi:hypothetical protein